ncbi:PPR13 [Auxenochlorella protothecoides x Auxenochlorella symbiontica]
MSPGLQWIQASTCSIRPLGHCPSNVFRCFRLPIYRRGVAWRLPARQEGLQPSVVWPEIPLSRLDDDGAGGDGDESEFERRTALGIYQTQEEIDEDEPERQRWHRQLAILARSGKYNKAAEVLDEMLRNGLTPGPRACHALLVAHASAGDAQGACLALELMQLAGLTPLPESLCLVIQLCVVEGELGLAAEVFDLPASQTSHKPWVTYCTALFGSDAADLGYSMLLQGEARGNLPPAELSEQALLYLLDNARTRDAAARLLQAQENGVVVSSMVENMVTAAQTDEGTYELLQRLPPNAAERQHVGFYCTILQEFLERREHHMVEHLQSVFSRVVSELTFAGVQPNKKLISYLVAGHLHFKDCRAAWKEFEKLVLFRKPYLKHLDDEQISELLNMLSASVKSQEMLFVMTLMLDEGRVLTGADFGKDNQGRSVCTSWLQQRIQNLKTFGVESEAAGKEWLIGDGVIIDVANDSVVDKEGNMIDIAAMNVRELKAELLQRKLQVSGSKTVLVKRLEKARRGGFDGAQKAPAAEPEKILILEGQEFWRNGKLVEVTVRQAEADDADADEEDDDFLPDATERDIDDTSAVESPMLVEGTEEDLAYEETLQEYIQHSGGRSANLQPSHRLSALGKDVMRAIMMHRLAPQLSAANFSDDAAYLHAVIEGVPLPKEREELRQALATCLGMAAFQPPSEEDVLP